MNNEERKPKKLHNVMIYNRRQMTVSGVIRVENFNENAIIAVTELGQMTVEGENLHINKLNLESGDLSIDGDITAVFYTDESSSNGKKVKSVFGKIFK